MANKIITQLGTVSAVASADEFEMQKAGEVLTKKATLAQIMSSEVTARALQDDNIEFAVGLTAGGAYPYLNDSWYLRTADHGSIIDRSGIVEDLQSDIMNALRLLDYQLYLTNTVIGNTVEQSFTISTADILALNAVPKVIVNSQDVYYEVIDCVAELHYGSTPFSAGTDDIVVRYIAGHEICTLSNTFLEYSDDAIWKAKFGGEQIDLGVGIELYCATAPTLGDSTMVVKLTYKVHTNNFVII